MPEQYQPPKCDRHVWGHIASTRDGRDNVIRTYHCVYCRIVVKDVHKEGVYADA